jgi:S1-C subfamily serine protease
VASNTANFVLGELVRHGHVRRAYIGVAAQQAAIPRRLRHAAGVTQPSAVAAVGVEPGSPAELAGIMAGDIILALDGVAISGADDLIRVLDGDKIGRTVSVELLRRGERRHATITPSQRAQRR